MSILVTFFAGIFYSEMISAIDKEEYKLARLYFLGILINLIVCVLFYKK